MGAVVRRLSEEPPVSRRLIECLRRRLRRRLAGRLRRVAPVTRLLCALTALSGAPHLTSAQDRLIRTFGQEAGLQPPIWALAQDSIGFLWIGAEGGLYRFDGAEFRRWAPDIIRNAVDGLTVSSAGIVTAVERTGRLFEITQTGARATTVPEPVRPIGLGRVTFDRGGRLWIARGDTVFYRTSDGAWHRLAASALANERPPRRLKANPVGGVDVATPTTLWRVEPTAKSRALLRAQWVTDVWHYSADRFVALTANPKGPDLLIEVDRGAARRLIKPEWVPPGRPISLIERQGTLWVAIDRWLFAARPGEPFDVLGLNEGINSGGPLLVDREGSLWLGSFVGLVHLPEPDTRTWTERHGLVTRHTTALTMRSDALWIATWGGTNVMTRTPAGWTISQSGSGSHIRSCADRSGVIWTASGGIPSSLLEIGTASPPIRHARPHGFHGCAAGRDSGMWMAIAETLFYARSGRPSIRAFAIPPGTDRRSALLHDRSDRLWVAGGESICNAPAARVGDGVSAWSCDTLSGAEVSAFIQLPSGTLWAGSSRTGLYARKDGRWIPLSSDSLPTRTIFALAPSPRGGVWMVGHGFVHRVDEAPTGWTVLERLSWWHGLMTLGGGDLVEDNEGTIWIASERGVTRVPASVRMSASRAPPIVLVDARVDDRLVPLDSVLRLPHDRNRLELRFAALSFRAPSQVRHQVRLGPDEPWSESRTGPAFRWVDLQPRDYQVEYRASLDGVAWSLEPLRFTFSVRPAWYRTPWAIGLAFGFVLALAWMAYRVRLAYLVGLERQRTRIALDLHDEVGSGLASVGILSSVMATDSLNAQEQRETAREIASAAEELGNAMSDIVWSLDPHAATLQELASRLAEHGERLTARGDVEFSTRFPDVWPSERLDVSIRRNVLLVGLEALHNAIRHATAGQVLLSLVLRESGWELSVRDDGVGFSGGASGNGAGHGLRGMQFRAQEIGARLDVQSTPDGGTTVALHFQLRAAAGVRTGVLAALIRRAFSTRPA